MTKARTTAPRAERLSVGRKGSRAERQADARAHTAERRLGFEPRSAAPVRSVERAPEAPAPSAVTQVTRTPGTPLPVEQREHFGRAFNHDFSHVRIHADPSARAAASSIGARAFTVGSHVALSDREPGVLTHELAHVMANDRAEDRPDVVHRLSVGEWFARLVGEGTYSDDELKQYLLKLEQSGKIEDTSESDDKARQVVKQGLHKKLSPDTMKSLEMRTLLIDEMLSGFTGDEDEQAILKILEDAPPAEREWLVKKVGMSRLEDNFHGEERASLDALFGRVYDQKDAPIPLDWHVQYQLTVPEQDVSGQQGVLLRNLGFRPEGATQKTDVATNEDLVLTPGQTQLMTTKPLDHPRNKGGEGFGELQVGPVDKEGVITPATDARRPVGPTSYPAIDPLKKAMIAIFDIKLKVEEFGQIENREGVTTGHTTGTKKSTQVAKGTEESTEESREVTDEASRTDSATLDYEQRLAKKKEREKSQSQSQTQSEEKGSETQKRKDTTKSESKTEGSETFGQTEKIGGSAEFSGKFDAELKGEIEKAAGGVNWTTVAKALLKLGKLAPGVYGRVLRLLGPVGEKIIELFEPGEDDLEIEFDAEGNFSLKGTFKAKKSVEGWRKFKSTTKGTSSTTGRTDIESQKKGTSKTQGTGQAQREGEESSEALRQGAGTTIGRKQGVTQGTKIGKKSSRVDTETTERSEEDSTQKEKATTDVQKKRIAVIDTATLSFKVM